MPEADRAAVSVAQIAAEQCWADASALERNVAKVEAWYGRAADRVDLVVFPELTLTGYIPLKGYDQNKKRLAAETAKRAVEQTVPRLAAMTANRRAGMIVGFMEAASLRHEMFNSVALLEDGKVRGVYRKVHLPVEENHYFLPGDQTVVLDSRAGRIGLIICYDMVFPESARLAALQGAEILCVPSNWLAIEDLRRLGEVLPVARALEQQMHVIFANGVGELEVRGKTWPLYGESAIVSATGEVIARAGADEALLDGLLLRDDLARAANVFPLLRDRRPDVYCDLVAPHSAFSRFGRGLQ